MKVNKVMEEDDLIYQQYGENKNIISKSKLDKNLNGSYKQIKSTKNTVSFTDSSGKKVTVPTDQSIARLQVEIEKNNLMIKNLTKANTFLNNRINHLESKVEQVSEIWKLFNDKY